MHKLLLCPPEYYDIQYEINPWMSRARKAVPGAAREQWRKVRDALQTIGRQLPDDTS
jgi:N-dimethylarginine dimethylaminohydrolase